MNEEEKQFMAAEWQKEFGVPIEVCDSGENQDRWCFYRLAAEYGEGKGKPKQLLNRAIKGEVLGGEVVLNLKVWMVNKLKNPQTPAGVRTFCEEMLPCIENIRCEMVEEILRRYKNPAGKDSLLALFHKLESMLPEGREAMRQKSGGIVETEIVKHVRDEVFSALEDIVC